MRNHARDGVLVLQKRRFPRRKTERLNRQERQFVRSWIKHERPSVLVNVFEGDPDTTHKPVRIRREVLLVAMGQLGCRHHKVQRLERNWLPSVELDKSFENGRSECNFLDVPAALPRILLAPGELVAEVGDHELDGTVDHSLGESRLNDDSAVFFVNFTGEFRTVGIEILQGHSRILPKKRISPRGRVIQNPVSSALDAVEQDDLVEPHFRGLLESHRLEELPLHIGGLVDANVTQHVAGLSEQAILEMLDHRAIDGPDFSTNLPDAVQPVSRSSLFRLIVPARLTVDLSNPRRRQPV